jgi:hypothetical protein
MDKMAARVNIETDISFYKKMMLLQAMRACFFVLASNTIGGTNRGVAATV